VLPTFTYQYLEKFMNGLTPDRLDDFLFSNPTERDTLELILSRKLPFPYGGKSGILLHGVWGTGKTTFAELLPNLLETAHSGTWNFAQDAGQMPADQDKDPYVHMFRCGGGLSSTAIKSTIYAANGIYPFAHYTKHDYFMFDEVDKLTSSAQQSLKSVMDLKRSMFIFTTNYLNKVDLGVINRCHLVEMNQAANSSAYIPLAQNILLNMGVGAGVVSNTTLDGFAVKAKGSLRNFTNDVMLEGLKAGGVMTI
jgi:ATPase family associated with various cellular activities (AAA)